MSTLKYYITTPIYYANGKPHVGHAYTTIAVDVLARYHRGKGDEVFFLTGTDEHGSKIAESAKKAGKSPQEFCDLVADDFKSVWESLGVDSSKFIRTTDSQHKKTVEEFMVVLKNKAVLYEKEYQGLYCVGCERFLTEKELAGGKCPDHNRQPEKVREKNWFFKLQDYLPQVRKLILSGKFEVGPAHIKKEVLGLIDKQELPDFSVSRRKVEWGIKLPWDRSQTAYVWVDALLNYISALDYPNGKSFKEWWGKDKQVWIIHLMAKDILKFHAVYWPAMLLAAGLRLPNAVFAHGFFTINGQKMSKTLGNIIDPNDLIKRFGVDATRYLLLSQFPFGQDGDIAAKRFKEKYNADLANGLGNLVSRVSNLVEKSKLEFKNLKVKPDDFEKKIEGLFNDFKFEEILKLVWQKISEANLYINKEKPWEIKDQNKLRKILEKPVAGIKKIAQALLPFMPVAAKQILKQFSQKDIKKGGPLFLRIK